MARVHLRHPENAARTWGCDLPVESPKWAGGALPIASIDHGHVTCVKCRRARDEAAPPEVEPDFVPGPAEPPRYGAQELSRMARRIVERSVAGETLDGPVWPSAEAALRSLWSSGNRSLIRSSADPDRFGAVQASRTASFGGPEHARIDKHRNAALAWERAWRRLALEPDTLARLCPWRVGPDWPAPEVVAAVVEDARRIAEDRIRGEANNEQLAGDETRRWRQVPPETPVTPHQIAIVVRYFTGAVRDALIASGEMRAPVAREEVERDGRGGRSWDPLRRLREARERARSG